MNVSRGIDFKRKRFLILTICAAVIAMFYPAIYFDYVWDDLIWLKSLGEYGGNAFFLAFAKPFLIGNVYWRPLAELSLYVQPGEKPQFLQHLINICLHVINVVLLWVVGNKACGLGRFNSKTFLLFLTLFFAFHPAFVEPVAWVSGRFDLLLTTAFLSGILLQMHPTTSNGRLIALGTVYGVALLVKESAVLLIPVYVGINWLLQDDTDIASEHFLKKQLPLVGVLACITIMWLLARVAIMGGTGSGFILGGTGPLLTLNRLYMVLSTIGAYLLLLLIPFKSLSTLYPVDQMLANHWNAVAGIVFLTAIIFLLGKSSTRRLGVVFAIFPVSLLLTLNIVQVGFPDNLIQNRYLYPSVAMVISALVVSNLKFKVTRIGGLTLLMLAVVWLGLAVVNIRVTLPLWRNVDALSSWLYAENPGSPYAANMRAMYLMGHGEVEKAIVMAGEVAVNKPTSAGYKILGDGHTTLGQCRDAFVYYQYAYDMASFPEHAAAGLLGMYNIKFHQDEDGATEIKDKIIELLADDPIGLQEARERMEKIEGTAIVCKNNEVDGADDVSNL